MPAITLPHLLLAVQLAARGEHALQKVERELRAIAVKIDRNIRDYTYDLLNSTDGQDEYKKILLEAVKLVSSISEFVLHDETAIQARACALHTLKATIPPPEYARTYKYFLRWERKRGSYYPRKDYDDDDDDRFSYFDLNEIACLALKVLADVLRDVSDGLVGKIPELPAEAARIFLELPREKARLMYEQSQYGNLALWEALAAEITHLEGEASHRPMNQLPAAPIQPSSNIYTSKNLKDMENNMEKYHIAMHFHLRRCTNSGRKPRVAVLGAHLIARGAFILLQCVARYGIWPERKWAFNRLYHSLAALLSVRYELEERSRSYNLLRRCVYAVWLNYPHMEWEFETVQDAFTYYRLPRKTVSTYYYVDNTYMYLGECSKDSESECESEYECECDGPKIKKKYTKIKIERVEHVADNLDHRGMRAALDHMYTFPAVWDTRVILFMQDCHGLLLRSDEKDLVERVSQFYTHVKFTGDFYDLNFPLPAEREPLYDGEDEIDDEIRKLYFDSESESESDDEGYY